MVIRHSYRTMKSTMPGVTISPKFQVVIPQQFVVRWTTGDSMKLKQSVIIFCLFSTIAMAEPGTSNIPKPLFVQVQRLSDLLKDSHAEWYSESTLVQMISRKDGGELAFVVFNIVGFGGSNNDIQYFSIFKPDSDDSGKEKFMLIDVMPIGGKGWRYVQDLNAKLS